MTREDWRRSWPAWLRGTAFGFPIGALPAGGAEIPTFLSYATERRLSKHPEEFGHGAIEGVAGPEAANNAAAAGVLVPLLTIGLPTSATAAVILTAFQSYGLQPGPQLFSESGPLVYALLASLYVGNVMLLVLNLPLARVWAKLLQIPAYGIYAAIMVFATLGTFATGGSFSDLLVLYVIGMLGVLMALAKVPVAPAVVGLILGPLFEEQAVRAVLLEGGSLAGCSPPRSASCCGWWPRSPSWCRSRSRSHGGGSGSHPGQETVRISFLLTNSSMPKRPSSRPKPDRFTPPKGSSTPSAPTALTKTMPASRRSATRWACSASVVKT